MLINKLQLIGDELIQLEKNTQCMADEQFHFADNKWDVTKNNNKNKKQEKTKKETNKQQ